MGEKGREVGVKGEGSGGKGGGNWEWGTPCPPPPYAITRVLVSNDGSDVKARLGFSAPLCDT